MKIALLGLGLEGRSARAYFEQQTPTPEITVFDPITPAAVAARDWSEFDLVLRSPSLPPVGQGLAAATYETPDNLANFHFSSLTQYFFAHCPAPIIGVTGTKGKGTTCSLATAVLEKILAPQNRRVFLVGNIGNPALDALDEITADDVVVFELSSFQLWDLEQSPPVAVVLAIEPDHLNVHRDYAEYVAAKSNIARHQTARDFCIFNALSIDARTIAELSPGTRRPFPSSEPSPALVAALDALQLLGAHNRTNAEAALLAVASVLGLELAELLAQYDAEIKASFQEFKGLPHRLELVDTRADVKFYDSSYSTDATAMQAALASFTDPVILILGGRDKTDNADFPEIKSILASAPHLKHVILVGESGEALAERYPELIADGAGTVITRAAVATAQKPPLPEASARAVSAAVGQEVDPRLGQAVLDAAVRAAAQVATEGDVVLFSPGAASFDLFKKADARGDAFQAAVQNLSAANLSNHSSQNSPKSAKKSTKNSAKETP